MNLMTDVLSNNKHLNLNRSLINFKNFEISSIINEPYELEQFKFDMESSIISHLKNETMLYMHKEIINYILKTQNIEFINLIGISDSSKEFSNEIINHIINSSYKNAIVSPKIGHLIQDSPYFSISRSYQPIKNGNIVYEIGEFHNIKIWIDTQMKWNDNKIILFNEIEINFDEFDNLSILEEVGSVNLRPRPRVFVNCKFDFRVNDFKISYIIDSDSCQEWFLFKKHNRDSKINNILDEED